jgi:hypothetical protein
MSTLFKGDPCQALLNAASKHGDVYLVSDDRRYFVAHRIVLISASDVLDRVLAKNCEFCGDVSDENVVVFFEGISGDVLKNFLSLIYTGPIMLLIRLKSKTNLHYRICLSMFL